MKKIKNNKGIALVSLTIAVIILIVLTSMLVYNARNGVKLRALKMMQNDIDLLSDEISSYYVKYGDIPAEIEYLGPINFEKQPNDDDKYYVIDLSAFEDITLNYGLDYNNITSSADTVNLTDVYIVNKQSMHVYYAKGIEMDGIMYYTNDEDEKVKLIGDRTGLKVGDYVDYVPDENTTGYTTDKLTEEITGSTKNTSTITQDQQYAKDGTGMTWQILRIYADGSIDLMGSPTSQTIWLSGANGYNNGVTIINDICEELYSNEKLKAKARNINYEDIIYWLTDMGEEVRDTYLYYTGGPNYGHTQTYTENRSYPNLYAQEIGAKIDSGVDGLLPGIDQETGNDKGLSISQEGKAEGYSKANKTLTVTNTFWKLDLNETNVGKIYSMLCREEEYWIASRYVRCEKEYVFFGIWCVEEEKLNSRSLFYSNSVKNNLDDSVRPIIRLKPDVQIENCIGENTIDNMHKIKY